VCRKLDYDLFTSPIPEAKSVLSTTKESMKRYINSKLGVLYIAMELDRRLQAAGVKNVRVNAVHPGQHSLVPTVDVGLTILMQATQLEQTLGFTTSGP
jgi:NAD(P)-dependent dehydrogenase (short-subunit alcohol dehydrogenase family)